MRHVRATMSFLTAKRVGIAAVAAIITQLSVGCSTQNGLTLPSLTTSTADPNSAQAAEQRQVALSQIIGAPTEISDKLSRTLVSSAAAKEFSVSTDKSVKAPHAMQGYLVAAADKTGAKLTYIWDISDGTGKHAHRIKGEEILSATKPAAGTDAWSLVTDEVLAKVANTTATKIDAWLPKPKATTEPVLVSQNNASGSSSQPLTTGSTQTAQAPQQIGPTKKVTTAKPTQVAAKAVAKSKTAVQQRVAQAQKVVAKPRQVATQPVRVAAKPLEVPTAPKPPANDKIIALVPTVLGAPGDGTTSLTSAIRQQLGSRGVILTKAATGSTYTVSGNVKMMPAGQTGKEDIAIEWRVIDPTGRKLGTVSQRNSIPKGSLDGAWGQTAEAAAAAAAEGIVKLLPKNE